MTELPDMLPTTREQQLVEKYNRIVCEFDVVCKSHGFLGYRDFCNAHEKDVMPLRKLSELQATETMLAKGKGLEESGKDLSQISQEMGLRFQTVRKYAKNGWKLQSGRAKFTSWRLTTRQKAKLLLGAKKFGSQGQFIKHAIEELGTEGIRTFVRSELGRDSRRKDQKLHITSELIRQMDGIVAQGVVASKQAILDASIGN